MRPKLRPDVRYVPVGDGVQVFSAAGSFGLAGASVQQLLDQLAGQLDGTRTLDSIVAGLPERHRRVVTKLIDTLVARRAAYDAAAVLPHSLQDWELARYSQEVAFAELASGSGAHWFERFRLAKVLLVGAGDTLAALVGTMLQLGSRGCGVLATGGAASADRYRSPLAAARREDPLLELVEVPDPGGWDSVAEVQPWLAGYQAVLHCDDQPRPGRAALLARAARAAGIPALHAVLLADQAWIGPAAGAGDRLGCWECGWRYLIGARSQSDPHWTDYRLDDEPARPGPVQVSPPLRNLVGAMLAMAYFRLVTEAGAGDAATNRLIRVDLATATAREHRFSQHPGCGCCDPPAPPPPAPAGTGPPPAGAAGPDRTDDDLSRAAAALHDPALGILLSIDEPDHRQLPLVVTMATVNDLSGSGAGPRTVTAAAPDHQRARRRAAVKALETAAALAQPGGPVVAAGYHWAEAVGRGLLRHAARLAAAGDGAGPEPRPLAAPLPEPARRLVEAAEVLGARLRLVDRTGPAGVPMVAVHGAGPAPVLAAALDLPDAVTAALEAAVGRLQAGTADQPRHPTDADTGTAVEIPADLGDQRWPDRLGWLAGCLAADGWQAQARPVTLAPPLAGQLPLLAEVTLARSPVGGAP